MKEGTGKKLRLVQWLLKKYDTKDWRIGKVTGWKHTEVAQDFIDLFGKQELLEQAGELERLGFLKVDWREFGQDIKEIHFPVDKLDGLYEFAGETSPKVRLLKARDILFKWRNDADDGWKKAYYDALLNRAEKGDIPPQVKDERLFLCLNRLPGPEKERWERVFSAQVLKDSKMFKEKYERRILTILREYSPYAVDDMEADEVLAEHGILTYAQRLEWKGPLTYILEGHSIDTSDMIYGTVVNAQTLEHAVPSDAGKVKKIVTIENKANYEDAVFVDDTIYIFTHGFFSPKERRFLQKLRSIMGTGTEYYHWGDMDYGGIRIFHYMKQYIFPDIKPLYMDTESFRSALHAGGGIPLKEEKREKLEQMDAGMLEELKYAILESGMEIEQETLCTR